MVYMAQSLGKINYIYALANEMSHGESRSRSRKYYIRGHISDEEFTPNRRKNNLKLNNLYRNK
jgi:hypothetical protein